LRKDLVYHILVCRHVFAFLVFDHFVEEILRKGDLIFFFLKRGLFEIKELVAKQNKQQTRPAATRSQQHVKDGDCFLMYDHILSSPHSFSKSRRAQYTPIRVLFQADFDEIKYSMINPM
jgi:hypothetical protein